MSSIILIVRNLNILTFFWCWRLAWWWPSSMMLFRCNNTHYIRTRKRKKMNWFVTRSVKRDFLLLFLLLQLSKWCFFSVFNNHHFITRQVSVVFFLLLLRRRRRPFLSLAIYLEMLFHAFARSIDQSLPLLNSHLNYVYSYRFWVPNK
jgi:hypothetical protein